MNKSTAAALTLGALAAALLACQAVTGQSRTPTPPEPTPTAPVSIDLTGTRWFIYYYESGGDYYEYELVFHSGGRLENSHPNESTPDNDAWVQTGDTVILLFNDSYATYEGRINGETISGTAVNIRGAVWSWDAYRLP
ncbi:MAG TPA: hypothetical protein VJJ46_04655 [Anaerolineales bacterium]|nr:hypothetical protein [Anaerolineales bacterium]